MKCVIVDNDVIGAVFGSSPPPAGAALFRWISDGKGQMVVGGKLAEELRIESRLKRGSTKRDASIDRSFTSWLLQVDQAGQLWNLDRDVELRNKILELTEVLINRRPKQENDQHIIALASVSGARLLYSNDRQLHKDFRNKELLNNPRGKVFSTLEHRVLTKSHLRLLRQAPACGSDSARR